MREQTQACRSIANNLANVNTTGYKREPGQYSRTCSTRTSARPAPSRPRTRCLPSGVAGRDRHAGGRHGEAVHPGQPHEDRQRLDIAIQGRGFFEILLPDGSQAFTRDGSFQINDQGIVVTSEGYQLQPPITLPQDAISITIAPDGTVSVQQPATAASTQVGSIQLSDFINPAGLQARGENLFLESGASGAPQPGNPGLNGLGTLAQGYVESSNVNVVEELVSMIETQRAYEMNSKAISTADQMLQFVSNNL
jgi:flagellar basal-body rod protein FlgG